jgi:hypothetical protein
VVGEEISFYGQRLGVRIKICDKLKVILDPSFYSFLESFFDFLRDIKILNN